MYVNKQNEMKYKLQCKLHQIHETSNIFFQYNFNFVKTIYSKYYPYQPLLNI